MAAVEAQAKKSMALLARPLNIDLQKTPILCWQWRIDAVIASADMTQKSGDDYAARVYLSFAIPAGPTAFGTGKPETGARDFRPSGAGRRPELRLGQQAPIGAVQDNAYTDRARLFVLRSGNGEAGAWVQEQRNVPPDLRAPYGEDEAKFAKLSGLAIATDTDNTGEEAHAGFADFRFVANAAECAEPTNAKPLKIVHACQHVAPSLSDHHPVLNEAGTIVHALDVLQEFRKQGAELIVVDGGSTDNYARAGCGTGRSVGALAERARLPDERRRRDCTGRGACSFCMPTRNCRRRHCSAFAQR